MKIQGIYAIRNTVSGRVYVGSAVRIDRRWYYHRRGLNAGNHHCTRLQAAWTADGADAFRLDVLEVVADATLLLAREQWWIDELNATYTHAGFNSCPVAGSPLGTKHSEATRQKMREASANRPRSTWGTISAANKSRVVSAETRAKISANSSNISDDTRAKLSASHLGYVHTAEARAKMGVRKGKKHTPEAIAKMRASSLGQIMSPESRAKMSASAKAWRQMVGPHRSSDPAAA